MLRSVLVTLVGCLCFIPARLHAAEPVGEIDFEQQTLPNGLRVIYAPLRTAPVVHVRVLYHVGSRDERPDRQGFAHMFEHMMFRGSAHVKPEEHMKLIGDVGGNSNAFTSFDQTVYLQTLPASHLEMALYLEADRMASFKVSEEIYKTERKVVAEEWRMRQNRPYGNLWEDLMRTAFKAHSYRWTPIGNMDHLRAAPVNELQDFFNTYYLPNNAVLVISGDIDIAKTKAMVEKYFGWIPKGPEVKRNIPAEPEQQEVRRLTVPQRVPLPMFVSAFRLPAYNDADLDAVSLLASILGDGDSSRLSRKLVNSESPVAAAAFASPTMLQDAGLLAVGARVLQGKDIKDVENQINEVLADVRKNGVTQAELDKVKYQARQSIINGRVTSESLASQLGTEALLANDPSRVNTELDRLNAVSLEDIKRVAGKYLDEKRATVLSIVPDATGASARAAATQASAAAAVIGGDAKVATAPAPVKPRAVTFPEGYAQTPPTAAITSGRPFEKGKEIDFDGVKLIVLSDHRLPLVTWALTMRRGSHGAAADKLGVAGLTADLVQRGTEQQSYAEFSDDLESRAINLNVSDGGDITRITGLAASDQLAHGIQRTRELLLEPRFDSTEFEKLKSQTVSGLMVDMEQPASVAGRELITSIYGDSPLGRWATPAKVAGITLEDVKTYHSNTYKPDGAILVFAGDVTVEDAIARANTLLDGWATGKAAVDTSVNYTPKPENDAKVIIIDRPDAKQATVRVGGLAYDIRTDEKFAGAVANRILSGGIDSRMMKYVRAEKGLVYTTSGIFQPNRHGGEFIANADTAIETTADAVKAMYHVIDKMRAENVTDAELATSKTRVGGSMLMQLQTIQQQAQFRVDGILNGYPIDYYDRYPDRINEVTAEQVKTLMSKFTDPKQLNIIVVAPAAAVQPQLKELGEVKVMPMPLQREGATTQPVPSKEMLKPGV